MRTSPTSAAPSPASASSTSAPTPPKPAAGASLHRTLQDRLVNELRLAGLTTPEAANAYLREHFIPDYNASFTRPPADPASAFVPLGDVDLDQVLCVEEERVVAPDNTVVVDGRRLQLAKQPGRPTCAGLHVVVRRHLDGRHTVWRGTQCLGHYAPTGAPVPAVFERALNGRFRVASAHNPPAPGRARRWVAPADRRRRSPRLPIGPGL